MSSAVQQTEEPESMISPHSPEKDTTLRSRPARQVTLDADERDPPRRATGESRRTGSGSEIQPGLLRRMTTGLFEPERPVGKAPGYRQSLVAAAKSNWLNVLLVFIPIGWALHFVKDGGNSSISDTAVFITNFIAIIPLAALLGFATEEAALRLGQTLGGLLNCTLGNAVELIVAILALIKCELAVVQSSLVGSILSNLLLVLGMCFFVGGIKYKEQTVKTTASQLNSSLLLMAVIAMLIPSAFHFAITTTPSGDGFALTDAEEGQDLLKMSHGVAILLLLLYIGFIVFQMFTHAELYADDELPSQSTRYPKSVTDRVRVPRRIRRFGGKFGRKKDDEEVASETSAAAESGALSRIESEEEEEVPQMNLPMVVVVLVIDTVIVGVTAEFLVSSINGLTEAHPSLSQEWVGLVLLPIVGNAAEHVTAVTVSYKDKLDLSISVAVGSSIQIALFVIPVIVLLGWCIGKPLTLLFDPFESVVVFLSVLVANQTLADGRSNWMEGIVLMFVYVIIATSLWFYPGSDTATLVGCGSS